MLTRRALLAAAGVGVLAGCAGRPAEPAPPAGGRTVVHPLGTSTVPPAPQRIVSLDSAGGLQVALELGAPLLASETLQGPVAIPPYVPQPGPGFTALGFNQLDLERLAVLAPDLIVGSTQRLTENYAKLAAIAPTVSYLNTGGGVRWQDAVRVIGDVVGSGEEIGRRVEAYDGRVGDVSAAHAGPIGRWSVALLRFTTDELRIVRGLIFGSAVLADVGLRRPPSTDAPSSSPTFVPVSEETVGVLADSDVLLYVVGGGGLGDRARDTFERYTSGGLWSRLPAVRAGRVAELDPTAWWDGYSVSAGLACCDELDRVLTGLPA